MGAPKLATTQRSLCCPANAQQASERGLCLLPLCRRSALATSWKQTTRYNMLALNAQQILVSCAHNWWWWLRKVSLYLCSPFKAKSLFWLPRSLWIDLQASCLSYGQQIAVHIVSINTYYNKLYNVFIMHLPLMCCEQGFKTSQQLVANRWFSMFSKLTLFQACFVLIVLNSIIT